MAGSMNLSTLVVKVVSDTSKFNKDLDKAEKKSKSFGETVKNNAGKLAAGGFVVASAAVTKFAGDSIRAFQGFEQASAEVFTLMPGMSADAMDQMRSDILDYSTEVGRTSDEVIPALYQAISAGVPAENVFDFMTTAHEAALGGVTDLETAVDGISSVVNAYGSEVVSATEASDLMFTAVKLGKTDFEQLSSSLFQVIPTASAIGVNFGDITAALAAMTAQGTPTSVATTQLRGALQELNKEGGKTSAVFGEAAGMSFREFITQGGNLQEALQILETAAEESGVQISDMFGSVEAGSAALTLTGSGTETFTSNLEEMNGAMGATAKAAETMSSTGARAMEEWAATSEALKIEVGESLAPALSGAAKAATGFFGGLRAGNTLIDFKNQLKDAGLSIGDVMRAFGGAQDYINSLGQVFTGGGDVLEETLMRGAFALQALDEGLEAGSDEFYRYIDAMAASAATAQETAAADELLTSKIYEVAEAATAAAEENAAAAESEIEAAQAVAVARRENQQAGYEYIDMLGEKGEAVIIAAEAEAEHAEKMRLAELAAEAFSEDVEIMKNKLLGLPAPAGEAEKVLGRAFYEIYLDGVAVREEYEKINRELDRMSGDHEVHVTTIYDQIGSPGHIPGENAQSEIPTPAEDGNDYGDQFDQNIPGHEGLDLMVPPGYPNDSFGPIWAETGERVTVQTAEQQGAGPGGITVNFNGPVTGTEEILSAFDEALLQAGIDADRIARTK